jgi:hypothetical protein
MNDRIVRPACRLLPVAAAALLGLAGTSARAQAAVDSAATPLATGSSPYYVGASEGITHASNVYSIPFGPSDTYSSTSLLGGLDQRIGRQRVFGNADVSLNRYASQTRLDNTGYILAGGLDWETLNDLSGSLGVGLNRQLSAPGASSSLPDAVRNMVQTQNVNAKVRWGGPTLMSVEATLGYEKVDYSVPAYVASNSRQESASLGFHYGRGGPLRLGAAARFLDTLAPQAFLDPTTGLYQENSVKSSNLDLLADYDLSGLLTANARVSYTKQTDSGAGAAGFSGLTGSLGIAWNATGKTSLRFDLARNGGLNANSFATYSVVPDASGSPQLVPSIGQYQNSQVSDSANLRLDYSATAKIGAFVGASYVRARLESTVVNASGSVTGPESIDSLRTAFLGANYAFARNWNLACGLNYQYRRVSGGSLAYAYNADTISCSARFQLPI